jgi:thiol:disulfide interchange protein DsbD
VNGQRVHQVGDLSFILTQSIAQLEVELSKAKEAKKFVLLDFYADWCISCKEMEINTFANPEVSQELKQFILLQVDVTKNSAENQALLKRFGLYGPPGILIFNLDSQEQQSLRVVGYMPPQRFIERLKQVNK